MVRRGTRLGRKQKYKSKEKSFPTLKSFSGAHATVASGFGFVVGKIEKLFDLIWPRARRFPRERDESERKWSNFAVRRSNFQLHSLPCACEIQQVTSRLVLTDEIVGD